MDGENGGHKKDEDELARVKVGTILQFIMSNGKDSSAEKVVEKVEEAWGLSCSIELWAL